MQKAVCATLKNVLFGNLWLSSNYNAAAKKLRLPIDQCPSQERQRGLHFESGRYLLNGLLRQEGILVDKDICDFLGMLSWRDSLMGRNSHIPQEEHGRPVFLKCWMPSSLLWEIQHHVSFLNNMQSGSGGIESWEGRALGEYIVVNALFAVIYRE